MLNIYKKNNGPVIDCWDLDSVENAYYLWNNSISVWWGFRIYFSVLYFTHTHTHTYIYILLQISIFKSTIPLNEIIGKGWECAMSSGKLWLWSFEIILLLAGTTNYFVNARSKLPIICFATHTHCNKTYCRNMCLYLRLDLLRLDAGLVLRYACLVAFGYFANASDLDCGIWL